MVRALYEEGILRLPIRWDELRQKVAAGLSPEDETYAHLIADVVGEILQSTFGSVCKHKYCLSSVVA